MKYIELTNTSKRATVDDEDYEWLIKYEWYLDDVGHAATLTEGGIVLMEQMIMFGEKFYEEN